MASFIPDAKTVRIAQGFSDEDGHVAQCRFYLAYAGAIGVTADYTAVALACAASVTTNLMPNVHSTWTQGETFATDLTSDTSPQGTAVSSTVGGLTGGRLPASTALIVSREVGRRYRGGHSRVYIPCGDDTKLQTDATWTAAFASLMGEAWATVESDTAASFWGTSGTVTAVMASFYLGFTNEAYGSPVKYRRVPTPRAAGVNFPVINYVQRTALGTQRRRLRAG